MVLSLSLSLSFFGQGFAAPRSGFAFLAVAPLEVLTCVRSDGMPLGRPLAYGLTL
jgi:hypothetical protein